MIEMYNSQGKRKNEYDWLLEFYIQITSFPVVTSTFEHLTDQDKVTLHQSLQTFANTMVEILPIVQERIGQEHVRTNSNS